MNDYNAGMIARSEHQHMKQSLRTVNDFDVRGQGPQPHRISNTIGKLFQSVSGALTSARTSINREPSVVSTQTVKAAVDNC
jgi:hypothetical protein